MGWQFWRKPTYFILRAEAADLAALAEIHEASFPQGWDADALARLLDSPTMVGWVATREGGNGKPLGFVLTRVTGDEAEIITIATDPAARNRGIGRALMGHVVRQLQGDRVRRLFLEVSEENAAALSLYRALGFRQVGVRKAYYASHGERSGPGKGAPSALVMELDLG